MAHLPKDMRSQVLSLLLQPHIYLISRLWVYCNCQGNNFEEKNCETSPLKYGRAAQADNNPRDKFCRLQQERRALTDQVLMCH